MAAQILPAAWRSLGWMSFTLAAGTKLELGGASRTTPTASLSVGSLLANGIPQSLDNTRFAERNRDGDLNGHDIKHAIIEIMSAATPGTPIARTAQDGSAPTATLGRTRGLNDPIIYQNARDQLFRFKLLNNGGGNMVVEVEVFE